MQCPSCGAISETNDCCTDIVFERVTEQEQSDWATVNVSSVTVNQSLHSHSLNDSTMNSASDLRNSSEARKSTLIEFPGVNRTPVPQWRKELSERVREVQERRAREAREAVELEQTQTKAADLQHQLELLPAVEAPPMNPLVAAALKRIERAHQPDHIETGQAVNMLATAVAYAPACEENELEIPSAQVLEVESEKPVETLLETEQLPLTEKNYSLTVVQALEEPRAEIQAQEPPSIPKRLIVEDPNDPALNYLDSISRTIRVEEADTQRASAFRRLVCALVDLLICALLTAPIALAMELTGTSIKDPYAIQVLAGCLVIVTFIYLTLSTALTGRTLAMRLLALRIIDTKTGLIPTGSQSVGRSFLYLGSLALAGVGILASLVSREGYAVHDRLTRTAVIRT
jgi:uncharacterized RDD family membrane protein YckC